MVDRVSIEDLLAGTEGVDLDAQRVGWSRARWWRLEATHAAVLDAVDAEVAAHGTIWRSWLRGNAGDPMTLLVTSMIWGFGNNPRGPSSVMAMLGSPRSDTPIGDVVVSIVAAAQTGAAAGFAALFDERGNTRVARLGVAFGTKLVHFAGYDTAPEPRPLVYDLRVWNATQNLVDNPDLPTPKGYVTAVDYERYCQWAEQVGQTHGVAPTMVEYVLFQHGGELRSARRQLP